MEWRDIESAPKDGTSILLGYFHRNLDNAIYEEGGEPIVARWSGRRNCWIARQAVLNSGGPFSPTHWMPTPGVPTEGFVDGIPVYASRDATDDVLGKE